MKQVIIKMRGIFLLLLITFLTGNCSCNNRSKNIISDVNALNEFIIKNTQNRDLILFGEVDHNIRTYKQTFLNYLRAYLIKTKTDTSLSRNIALILEENHSFKKLFTNYLSSGNAYDLMEFPSFRSVNLLSNLNLPDIEFYFDLRQIIDSVAFKNRSLVNKYDIKLIFPENDREKDMSPSEAKTYFEKERDIYSSDYINKEMKSLPGYKFFGLYGVFHLDKRNDPKTPIPKLARLLTEKNISLYTIALSTYSHNNIQPLENDNDIFKIVQDEYYDLTVAFKEVYNNDVLYTNIPSINLLQSYIDINKNVKSFPVKSITMYWQKLTNDTLIKGNDTLDYIIKNMNRCNAVKIISNGTFILQSLENLKNMHLPIQQKVYLIRNITGIESDENSLDFWQKKIIENSFNIKIRLLTALIYCGTANEKQAALKELCTITNKYYKTEKEWYNYYMTLKYK